MDIGYVASREIRACIRDQRYGDQRAVESEQAILDHPLVGSENRAVSRADNGAKQADRAVDPGVVENPRKNHGSRNRVILEYHLADSTQDPVDKSQRGMISELIMPCRMSHSGLLCSIMHCGLTGRKH